MGSEALPILMFIVLMVAIALGHPLAVTLAAVATLFGLIDNGGNVLALIDLFTNNNWGNFLNYTLVSLPLFIFMAQVLDRAKVSEELFEALYIILGGLKGGLGIAIIVVSTVFAATTGIVGASVVAMSLMAAPSLLKKGYNKGMSAGIITSSGTLGILIPPSIMLVVYAPQAGLSVGQMFMGAVFPGLLLSALYIAYVAIRCRINPALGPSIPADQITEFTAAKFLRLLKALLPPVLLIAAVLGTIFLGIAPPTEAAAVGCSASILLAVCYGKFSWELIRKASIETLKVSAFVVLIAALCYAFVGIFMSAGSGDVVARFILSFPGGKWVSFTVIMAIVFMLGMFIEWIGIVFIVVPIFTPIMTELGFNPLWAGMMVCINLQMAFQTPPMAMSIFVLKGTAPKELGVTMWDIIKGVIPFLLIIMLVLVLCSIFPEIILWLPEKMIGSA